MTDSNKSKQMNRRTDVNLQSIETFHVICLITNEDQVVLHQENDVAKFRRIVNNFRLFNDRDACIDYITELATNKFFLILSAHIGEQIIPLIDQCSQIDSIYIYLASEMKSVLQTEFYRKISGNFVDIDSICEQLNFDARRCSNNLLSMSSIPFPSTRKHQINGKDVSFMYSQLIRDLFLDMDLSIPSIRDMIFHFSIKFEGNERGLALIDELDRDYCSMQSNIRAGTVSKGKSIWWYTRCGFVFEVINQALRRQLKELCLAQSITNMPLTVYRGQAMLNEEFEQHKSNINGLLTINNFLSTSTDYQ
ncbi:unnamed protein product, partial [Rotaria sp. Silwood1]